MSNLAHTPDPVSSIADAALRDNDFGMCVLPLWPRTKKPAVAWEQYQQTRPTEAECAISDHTH